jgi:hypothetical protein
MLPLHMCHSFRILSLGRTILSTENIVFIDVDHIVVEQENMVLPQLRIYGHRLGQIFFNDRREFSTSLKG